MKKLSRRVFLKFTGVVGLGTLAACVTPPTPEKIVEFQTQVVTQVVAGTPVEKIVTQIVAATAAPTATPKPTTAPLAGKSLLPVTTPREELFVADQIFRYGAPGNFNLHLPSSTTPHRHALMMETFWYRDQETGVRLYGVAKSDPVYNADFTSMKVDLRDNLAWSDGVAFNADDVVYTVQTIMGNNQLAWNPDLTLWVELDQEDRRLQRGVHPQKVKSPLPLPVRSPLERRLHDAKTPIRKGVGPGDLHQQ